MVWLLLSLPLAFPNMASAQDCSSSIINLNDQPEINAFQATYGPCTRVSIDLNIEDFSEPGNEIVDLTPLSGLTEVGNILFISHTSLTSLAGLENLTTVKDLTISANASLGNLAGLSGLNNVTTLVIQYNNGLTNLSGLSSSLQSLDLLEFTSNSITDLVGLPATLTQVRRLRIWFNTALTSLNGLPALDGIERIFISENEGLNDLSGLAASTMSADLEESTINISFNFGLTTLEGLPAVSKLGWLEIEGNPDLTTLGGMEALQEIWQYLRVVDNSDLADCSILKTVLDGVDDGDPGPGVLGDPANPPDGPGLASTTIENNDPEGTCNSITDIVFSPSDLIYADGFEGG